METLTLIANTPISPLPESGHVLQQSKLLKEYYQLYLYYHYGTLLPAGFPKSIIRQFPNRSYNQMLKTAISNQTNIVNAYIAIQNEYLKDYYTLYVSYVDGDELPEYFPETIISEFPSSYYRDDLKTAIAQLQKEINAEKATM
jgi:hypothetical protein